MRVGKEFFMALGSLAVLSMFEGVRAGMGAIRKSNWFVPYTLENGRKRTTMPGDYRGRSGVYFIKDIRTGKIVYVGSSALQLKDTIYRHFREWVDVSWSGKQFERVTYPEWQNYKIRVIECTQDQSFKAEKYFIRKLQPRDNPLKYANLSESEVKQIARVAEKIKDSDEEMPW